MVIKFTYNGGPMKDTTAIRARAKWQRENQWDTTTSPDRQVPSDTKYMAIDLQTHNCKRSDPQVDTSRAVEVAWMLFRADGTTLEEKKYLLKPYGEYDQITESATNVHGINMSHINKFGVAAHLVFDELTKIVHQLPQDGFVVAHDMDVKHTIMRNSLCLNPEQQEVWDAAPKCNCNDKTLLKHLPLNVKRKYYNFKYVEGSLSIPEMLRNIGQTPSTGAYDVRIASLDVQWTWDIFLYYKDYKSLSHKELEWKVPILVPSLYPGIMMRVNPGPLIKG